MRKWERPRSKYKFYFLLRKWIYLGSTYNKNWPVVNEISVLLTKRQDPQKLAVFGSEVFCTKKVNFLVRSWTNFANFIDNLVRSRKSFANFLKSIFTAVLKKTLQTLLITYLTHEWKEIQSGGDWQIILHSIPTALNP